jgi:hypothetical protein
MPPRTVPTPTSSLPEPGTVEAIERRRKPIDQVALCWPITKETKRQGQIRVLSACSTASGRIGR